MNVLKNIDARQRNAGIDLLRALTMFVMIFVNDLWSIDGYPSWLGHAAAKDDFMGLADVVFPCFLFVVGMSIPLAIERRFARGFSGESTVGHILGRTLALLLMGVFTVNSESGISPDAPYSMAVYRLAMVAGFILVWNNYPDKRPLFTVLKVLGIVILAALAITFRDSDGGVFSTRWWGILGLIGWSYLVCAMVYLFTRDRLKWLIAALGVFVVIGMLLTPLKWSGEAILSLPRGNFLNQFLSILHIGNGGLPALVMGGTLFTVIITKYRPRLWWFAVGAAVLLGIGVAARQFWILSKIGATPTLFFYVSAIAVAMYALLTLLSDRGWAGWMGVIKPAGTATLTCYIVPYAAYSIGSLTGLGFPDWASHGWLGILHCICFALLVIGITWCLNKVYIKLKI